MELLFDDATAEVTSCVYRLAAGDTGGVQFELVLRIEQSVDKWWSKLPDRLKLCDHVFDLTKEVIENTVDVPKLKIAYYMAEHILVVYTYAMQTISVDKTDSASVAIKDKLISRIAKMTDVFVSATSKINSMDTECNCK